MSASFEVERLGEALLQPNRCSLGAAYPIRIEFNRNNPVGHRTASGGRKRDPAPLGHRICNRLGPTDAEVTAQRTEVCNLHQK